MCQSALFPISSCVLLHTGEDTASRTRACMLMHGDAIYFRAHLTSDRCIIFGGVKANAVELEDVRLYSVVRRLGTIDGKRNLSDFVMCAFAPSEQKLRRGL